MIQRMSKAEQNCHTQSAPKQREKSSALRRCLKTPDLADAERRRTVNSVSEVWSQAGLIKLTHTFPPPPLPNFYRGQNGGAENAGLENAGVAKMQGWKTRDWKTRHQTAGVENAGLENAGV